ncbi:MULTISPECIES: hypothetical protein [Sphingomonas]|uniref:Uncharacterized protein n=1 Tax=Sphingomonas lycopersici TaxID=2951807 RepID=A0AA41Z538_9SPHN|nr:MULTISPECIES: hypothetical protein [Sphingomonas]MCW6534202.1 hypothetical protein [Sphingomonas lycopersici]
MTPLEIAAFQQELFVTPRMEILRLYLDLEENDPRFEVVEAWVRTYRLNEQAA